MVDRIRAVRIGFEEDEAVFQPGAVVGFKNIVPIFPLRELHGNIQIGFAHSPELHDEIIAPANDVLRIIVLIGTVFHGPGILIADGYLFLVIHPPHLYILAGPTVGKGRQNIIEGAAGEAGCHIQLGCQFMKFTGELHPVGDLATLLYMLIICQLVLFRGFSPLGHNVRFRGDEGVPQAAGTVQPVSLVVIGIDQRAGSVHGGITDTGWQQQKHCVIGCCGFGVPVDLILQIAVLARFQFRVMALGICIVGYDHTLRHIATDIHIFISTHLVQKIPGLTLISEGLNALKGSKLWIFFRVHHKDLCAPDQGNQRMADRIRAFCPIVDMQHCHRAGLLEGIRYIQITHPVTGFN